MSTRVKRKHRMSYWDKVDLDVLEATSENFRIEVDVAFQNFIADSAMKDYSFPSTLNNFERKHVHQKAASYNLVSRSHGKDPNRTLTVYKKGNKSNFESFFIDLAEQSKIELNSIRCGVDHRQADDKNVEELKCEEKVFGKLSLGDPPLVAEPIVEPKIRAFQQLLPIYEIRNVVLDKIRNNRVIIVASETGSGKTTQIPQFIMDDCRMRGETCRILCTQPRRISAVSVAERVSHERGSLVGEKVGYHIRLESRLSTNCNLIYCTNGVLIRSLMSGDRVLQSLTHIIIDEVHERDKLSDFLLICLKESLKKGANVKLILMSATIKVEKFQSYFHGAQSLQIPGRLFEIKQVFLDEILQMTGYDKVLIEKMNFLTGPPNKEESNSHFDACMIRCLQSPISDRDEAWSQVLQFIFTEEVSVNYQHSQSHITALCIAVIQDNIDMVENLCNLGADPNLPNHSGSSSAMTLAEERRNEEIILLLNMSSSIRPILPKEDLLTHYYKTTPDEEINYELLTRLICTIHNQYQDGAILVFLPGYDDIMMCHDYIVHCPYIHRTTYKVFCLHGSMNIKEQHQAFKPLPIRKIILSTNIAETSVTINDVVYVIDSGKAKIQTYDSCSGLSSLQTQWISKACVKQRAGRAGRTQSGVCFHLYSRLRHDSFMDERTPEILRVPLEELCLNTKTLAGKFSSIYNFLLLAPDPPSSNTVKTAIENLECLGALDNDENLTPLGEYLSQLTIEPHLGKMLIYSVIFKCLDPVLTIVASLAHKDPFQLPPQANLRTQAAEKRKSLTEDTFSDHMVYLKAFYCWQDAVRRKLEKPFCHEFFISSTTMETILKTRSQLLGQLRAARFVSANGAFMHEVNEFADNWPMVKAVISAGLYPKLSFKKNGHFCTRTEKKVLLHNSSPLCKENINMWLVYDEMVKVRNGYHLRGVTPVTPITISLMCGVKSATPMVNYLEIDEWLEFEFTTPEVVQLRKSLELIIEKKLLSPANTLNDSEEACLRVLGGILIAEDLAANMVLPENVKYKPKFFEIEQLQNGHRHSRDNWRSLPSTSNGYLSNGLRSTGNRSNPRFHNGDHGGRRDDNNYSSGGRGRFPKAIMPPPPVSNLQPVAGCSNYPTQVAQALSPAIPHDLSALWHSAFVLIRVRQESSIHIAYDTNKWIFSPQTERQIFALDNGGVPVYLIYAVHRMNSFYGIAKFMNMEKYRQKLPGMISWVFRSPLPFKRVTHLRNPLNSNRLIHDGVDGQLLANAVAIKLWELYQGDSGRPLVRNIN